MRKRTNTRRTFSLSKSDFIRYLKCPNELWLRKNKWDFFDNKPTPETQFLSNQGYQVQDYAERLIYDTVSKKMKSEVKAVYKNLNARADIIVQGTKYTSIYEVKSSTELKDQYIYDLAFQNYVFENAGYNVKNLFLVLINNQYVRNGEIEPEKLFKVIDLTSKVKSLAEIEQLINDANAFINGPCPDIVLEDSCEDRDKCPFNQFFFPNIPDYSVFNISRLKKEKVNKLLIRNIVDIKDVPDDFELSENQRLQVDVAKSNRPIIRNKEIKDIINTLNYPLYFIDYESINFAIPKYQNYRPYQQAVFQYSLFIQEKPDSKVVHKQFVANGKKDPALDLLKSLRKDITSDKGTFIVWNKTFERLRNIEMAKMYPEFKDLMMQFNDNIFDLMTIFSQKLYVHPDFKGKTSLKYVLPVLTYKSCYSDLDINNGQLAGIMWAKMLELNLSTPEKQQIRENLYKYCEMDTIGMVRILDHLKGL